MKAKLKTWALKFKQKTSQIYLCLKAKETPWYAKLFAGLTIAYALSPVDLIPDFIPILGYLDDLIILPFLVWITMKLIPKDVWEKYELESKEIWKEGKPKKWYFGIPIILIWILLITIVVIWIIRRV